MIWRRKSSSRGSGPSGPAGHRAYVIGDVHGRLDLLDELLDKIETDHRARSLAKTTIVFLGDLIDRGPRSAQVVERLRLYQPPFAQRVFLMGNHEEILLRILDGEADLIADWLRFGGAPCAESYGINLEQLRIARQSEAVGLLEQAIPHEHRTFLASFVDTASFGQYLFVHAGVRPGVPLASQLPHDLRWIRLPFLDDERDHGKVIVHGHTISEDIDIRPNRIGLDTGAYRTGVLSALGIEEGDRWVVQSCGLVTETHQRPSVANYSVAY